MRDFLLRASVLEELSAAACDAVLETSDSAAMLAEIERANLFLVPLDRHGETYRFHRLFADVLRRELAHTRPELVAPAPLAAPLPGTRRRATSSPPSVTPSVAVTSPGRAIS